jgi:hypothetical protein
MLKKIICFVLGHAWKQVGSSKTNRYKDTYEEENYLFTETCILLGCSRCFKFYEMCFKRDYTEVPDETTDEGNPPSSVDTTSKDKP